MLVDAWSAKSIAVAETATPVVKGLGNHCPHRSVIGIDRHDGAFAEMIAVPEANLHLVPDSVSDDEAVFVEPLAAAFQIGRQVELDGASRRRLGGRKVVDVMRPSNLVAFARCHRGRKACPQARPI